MSHRLRVTLWLLVPIIVVAGEAGYVTHGLDRDLIALDTVVGLVTMSAGIVLWSRRPRNRLGPLLFAAGVAWSLSGFFWYSNGFLVAIGGLLLPVHFSILLHVLLAYPSGRLRSRADRALVAIIYGNVALFAVALMAADPRALDIPGDNALFLIHIPGLHELVAETLLEYLFIAESVAAVGILVMRWHSTTPTARRVYAPVVGSALLLLAAKAGEFTVERTPAPAAAVLTFSAFSKYAKLIVPLAFLFGLLRSRIRQGEVGEFLIELDTRTPRIGLGDALSRTLRDPSLEIAYWLADRQCFVDVDGRRVELPADRSQRAVTMIERAGEPVGAIIHDPALSEEGRLLDAVSAAAQLAMENERLQAEIRSTLDEVRASRARIVEAGDAERRRVERNLHDGAQQRLLSLSLGLSMVRDRLGPQSDPTLTRILDESRRDASQAIMELRNLAQGIHPAVLTEEGLSAAVESLAERASIPVSASVPPDRYPPLIEATVYFVISEALANVAKYARATRTNVRVARMDGSLIVEVEDDGQGGADPTRGSGLRGLDDRVAAMGGTLEIESQLERGTHVRAVIPCA